MKDRTNRIEKPSIKRDQSPIQIAKIFDVGAATVRRWPLDGCPYRRSRHNNKLFFNDGEVRLWLETSERNTKPGRPVEPKSEIPNDLGGDKDYWLARKYRNQCLEDEGTLVNKEEYRRCWMTEFQTIKSKFRGLGSSLAPQCVGLDAGEVQSILETRIEQIFKELSVE